MNATALKRWLQRGDFEKLENVVLEGRGARLLGETSPDLRTRVFLKGLPNYLTKISKVHEAVSRGSLTEVQHIVADEPKKKLAIAKDRSGTPLIHKAVYHDQPHIVEWLVNNYPITTQQKDKEGRTALHYCTACRNPESIWDILVEGGCDASVCDKRGNPAAYYLEHSSEIELSESWKMAKRKINSSKENLDIKPSNIRIWIHNRDIGKLQHVLWEGHGLKLRCETSNNPRVRKFLEAVPFIMVTIKDIHTAVVNNDLEGFRKKLEEPISPIVLCSKDSNGLNVLHKAAGLGFMDIARDILERYQTIVNVQDNDGKTPLHYAAAVKDDGAMYDLLMEYEADGSILDNKQKAAAFYKNRPSDVDPTNLTIIPEAPRVSGTTYPKNWDWRILEVDDGISRGMRKVVSSTEIDSAFGSTDSAMKSLDGSSKEISEIQNDEEEHREVEKEGVEEEEEEEEEEEVQQQKEGEEEEEEEEEKEDQEEEQQQQQEEEKNEKEEQEPEEEQEQKSSSDDDVVTGGMTNEEETAEPEVDANEKLISNNEERNDPSTGDSGVDAEEDQVIVGEHRELPEAELTGHSMAIDKEVVDLLDNGNMEQLAALVLNGDGRRLVGRQSSNPELQAFIDNVPAYMGKIHAVHMAAKEGNLRDLQNALDRRKFAVARDSSSPHGATPLHVAVIFGSTAVIRYLAGRFPETTQAIDIDGRTPLHYAATLADNGHYYNLLLHLGANPLLQDNFGQKADFYKDNQEDLSHKKLLRDFGAPENLADRMLEDKDENQLDIPIFRSEEGQYLASSLGDPLIKGLTEVANNRPKDPVTYLATYLYNFANKNKVDEEEESNVMIIPEGENGADGSGDDQDEDDAGYPQSPVSDVPESTFSNSNRDEHGQSMLHFAVARSYSRDGLYNFLQEAQVNVGFRDELYRTARDVAELSDIPQNVVEIDRWVVYLAARGETEKLIELLLEGYDHILDVEDEGLGIVDAAAQRGHESTVQFLQSIPNYVAQREEVHTAIRAGDADRVKEFLSKSNGGGKLLAVGKNMVGRCSLHIAVLRENEDIVKFIVKNFPETLRIGDNLERTALHYAMGVPSVEVLSNILIKAGAKRIIKDLKSRQPSYYFMNKSDIEKIQEEEESLSK
ncbi:uncharacterized protein [Prorops nasuta]|uniref:uncharacterized protein isoform X2 n=1 Tax=Prorops nasuta TaxID=863751 RepID=UPI0034CF2676